MSYIIGHEERESFMELFLHNKKTPWGHCFTSLPVRITPFSKATTARFGSSSIIKTLARMYKDDLYDFLHPVAIVTSPYDRVTAMRNGNNLGHYNYAIFSRNEKKFHFRQSIEDTLDCIDCLICNPIELPLLISKVWKGSIPIIEKRLKEA